MRRIGGVWEQVVSFNNLLAATQKAARGKKQVLGVARFLERREHEVLKLGRELRSQTYRPGATTTFWIHDPKKRQITASPFRDRVVHHALIDPLEPLLDRRMIDQSHACRRQKGQHVGLRYAQQQLRRHAWFLKLDIRQFFPSLSHRVVMETLRRILKDRRVLELCEVIVGAGSPTGRGLPIGHLTSQWFANLVLDRLDHYVKERLRVPGYLRYMDDLVLFDDEKSRLLGFLDLIRDYLAGLDLALKERGTILAPRFQGLPFLGFMIYPRLLRLRPENRKRSLARLRRRWRQHARGELCEARLADCVRSAIAHLRAGNTLRLRRNWFSSEALSPFLSEQVASSSNRVNRGGSFNNAARDARSSNRNNNAPTIQNNNLGLRLTKASHARSWPPPCPAWSGHAASVMPRPACWPARPAEQPRAGPGS